MKKSKIFLTIAALLFSSTFVFSQEENKEEKSARKIPEGMEIVTIGGSGELIVPKGALVRKVGAQLIVEGSKEYMSRRFEEMEERLIKIEKAQDELKKEIKAIKEDIKGAPKSQ